MAQIIAIYGLVVAVVITNSLTEKMALYTGFVQLGAGLAVGLCGLAAGFAIGIVGDAGGEFDRNSKNERKNSTELTSVASPRQHAAAPPVRRHDPDPHLCRGVGPVRHRRVRHDAEQVDFGGH